LSKVSLSLFEVRGNEVVAARYVEKGVNVRENSATYLTLDNLHDIKVAPTGREKRRLFEGSQLIPRSAVTRLYLRSLKAYFKSKWRVRG